MSRIIIVMLITTLFRVDFDLVKQTNKYQLTKLPSEDIESTKYIKRIYL